MMTVKELIEKLKEFPEDLEVLNEEYFSIHEVYEDTYPDLCSATDKDTKYVIIS